MTSTRCSFPAMCYDKAGKPMTFEVERPTPSGEPQHADPDGDAGRHARPTGDYVQEERARRRAGTGVLLSDRPIDRPLRPDSPAAKAGLKPGDVISALTLKVVEPKRKRVRSRRPSRTHVQLQGPVRRSWFGAFIRLQERQYQEVELVGEQRLDAGQDHARARSERGFTRSRLRIPGPARARCRARASPRPLKSGYDRTIQTVMLVYSTFRSLVQRRVSPKNLGGPIMIFQMGYGAAGTSFSVLVFFLGILSINLAVLNFLPIPPLDGGQMVFLIAEKVRGRPLPDSAVIAGSYVGLFLVLCLMVFVTYQDIYTMVKGWW